MRLVRRNVARNNSMKPFFRRLLHRYRSFRERRRARSDNATIRRQQEQIAALRQQLESQAEDSARNLERKESQISLLLEERDHYIAIYEREKERVTFETRNFVFRGEQLKEK